jgi:hypothetical protein
MLRTTPPAVGRIYGRCRPGDRRWTIEFAPDNVATDSVTYRIGAGRPRTVNTRPSQHAHAAAGRQQLLGDRLGAGQRALLTRSIAQSTPDVRWLISVRTPHDSTAARAAARGVGGAGPTRQTPL